MLLFDVSERSLSAATSLSLRRRRSLRLLPLFRVPETTNDLGLPLPPNITVARKHRENVLMAEILRPSLVLLGDFHILPPSRANVFRKLCGLK